jgi:hypothetical protein
VLARGAWWRVRWAGSRGLGALAIPGVGPFVATGPIIAASSGEAVVAGVVRHYDGHLNTGLTDAEKSDLVEYLKSL